MNCRECQERIMLDAANAEVERHLETCAECREFRASLHEVLGLLEETHDQALGDSQLAPVRDRVRARIASERRSWRPVWAGGAAAAAVFLMLWVGKRHERPATEHERPIASALPIAPRPAAVPAAVPKPKLRARVHRVRKVPPPPPAEPLTVKLITDDPNVVIYWIIDAKGD
jgi:hypothetical protein